ncbi:hypothetical protein [Oscillibacter sp.]|uniref:hypothetical protein n=1 Tax=Oscillibacter sp. TaxID=1945593 RepID=UPI0033969A04
MLKALLNKLNEAGGLISIISLLLSIFIWFSTGSIKRSIIQKRQIKEYKTAKRSSVKRLKSIAASIQSDSLFDNAIKVELLTEINALVKYKGFIDFNSWLYIYQLNWILRRSTISEKNANRTVSLIASLCGRMDVEPVNKEMG